MSQRHALGDPRVAWTVLLTAHFTDVRVLPDAGFRLEQLVLRNGWGDPTPLSLIADRDALTLAADHRFLDGQAMLSALSFLLDAPVRSAASGVGPDRAQAGLGLAGMRRLVEALVRPPATVAPTGAATGVTEDVMVRCTVPRRLSTSDLVVAATRVLAARSSGPVSVAVGVAGPIDMTEQLGDRSGYLRIPDARQLSRPEVSAILRTAPLQPGGTTPSGVTGRLAQVVTRVLANRLGSSILVSHLGDITAEGVRELSFYPVSGGASGLSLGAATVDGRTTITLRARGSRHSRDGLQELLEAIAAAVD